MNTNGFKLIYTFLCSMICSLGLARQQLPNYSFEAGKGNSNAKLWIDDIQLVYKNLAQNAAMNASSAEQLTLKK
jgi:hypothetical protein